MKHLSKLNILLISAFLLLAGFLCLVPVVDPPDVTQTTGASETSTVPSSQDAAVMATTTLPVPATTLPPPTIPSDTQITAKGAFVYNCTGDYLAYSKGDMTETLYPASITKLFSAWVALQHLEPDHIVTVGEIITTVPQDSSFAWLTQGDRLTVEDLIKGMLLPSGGDAARALAVAVGRTLENDPSMTEWAAMERFVAEMNYQADLLGMQNTHFVNPDGYHTEDHYSCLADLLLIGRLSMENDVLRSIAALAKTTVTLENGLTLTWENTNLLLQESTPYFSASAVGLKTGYTGAAGSCLMAAFQKDGEYILIGIFGSETKETRFTDALTLFEACR